jgi:hypothetical protein
MKHILSTLIFCLLFAGFSFANNGDTITVNTHNATLIQTNPAVGHTEYPAWGVFPSDSVSIRKVLLYVKFACPTGLHCGEWDYLNYIYLKRKGGVDSANRSIELARIITPYGYYFAGTWKHTWVIDITDFEPLLHDSVEIEYRHTGYEAKNDRGWLVTLNFEMIEGPKVMEQTSMKKLWYGSWQYGNPANDIETHIRPDTFTSDNGAVINRLRLLQTGHGAENREYCSEFCDKKRSLTYDGQGIDTQHVWRLCGFNSIPAQGGTWVYDRANWCPGSMVEPYVYNLPLGTAASHIVDIAMDTFTASGWANYVFSAQEFQYKPIKNKLDASIESIFSPNNQDEYARINPVCSNPLVEVKNNGSSTISSLTFDYEIGGEPTQYFTWTGTLKPLEKTIINLGNFVMVNANNNLFRVNIGKVNGKADDYPTDNQAYSTALVPKNLDSLLIFYVKTNNYPNETDYVLKDDLGNKIIDRKGSTLAANTVYRDTVSLKDGCYTFSLYDKGNDGLSFWANSAQGSGMARIYWRWGMLLHTFATDFGSETRLSFQVGVPQYHLGTNPINMNVSSILAAFPNPSNDQITLDWQSGSGMIEPYRIIVRDIMGRVMWQSEEKFNSGGRLNLVTKNWSNGIYTATAESNTSVKTVKFVVEH